jgi:hypothetical protein
MVWQRQAAGISFQLQQKLSQAPRCPPALPAALLHVQAAVQPLGHDMDQQAAGRGGPVHTQGGTQEYSGVRGRRWTFAPAFARRYRGL